jgi:hypothetical protein
VRFLKLTLMLTGLAAVMLAADPFAGTWKLNPAKTKYKTGAPAKEQTIVITEAGSDVNVKVNGIAADGSKLTMQYTVPAAGGTGKIESTAWDGINAKRIGPTEREMTYMKGGKAVYTTHSKLSADGKSLSVNAKGTNPLGVVVEGTSVYDKQ